MKCLILISFITFSAISCEKKNSEMVKTDTTKLDSALAIPDAYEENSTDNCYFGVIGKDSIFLSLNDNLGTITGKMRYKNFEKDSSFGDVIGSKNGDTIQLNYTFQSEGTTSDKEINFLKKEDRLLEGMEDQKVDGQKSVYSDRKKMVYSDDNELKSVDCSGFEKNFVIEKKPTK